MEERQGSDRQTGETGETCWGRADRGHVPGCKTGGYICIYIRASRQGRRTPGREKKTGRGRGRKETHQAPGFRMHGKLRAQGTDTKVGDYSGKDDNSDDGNKGETSTTPHEQCTPRVYVTMKSFYFFLETPLFYIIV
jgi:hypothetical protein